jgi:hypothetical protein
VLPSRVARHDKSAFPSQLLFGSKTGGHLIGMLTRITATRSMILPHSTAPNGTIGKRGANCFGSFLVGRCANSIFKRDVHEAGNPVASNRDLVCHPCEKAG